MGPGQGAHTLQPTALVHEVWMKVADRLHQVNDRAHFFATAALAMRHVLADYARAAGRQKRGGDRQQVTLIDCDLLPDPEAGLDLVAMHDALEQLHRLHERQALVVQYRVFGTLTIEETARLLEVSPSTIKTDWSMARAWLVRELAERD